MVNIPTLLSSSALDTVHITYETIQLLQHFEPYLSIYLKNQPTKYLTHFVQESPSWETISHSDIQ